METRRIRASGKLANRDSSLRTALLACLVASVSYLSSRVGGALMLRPQMVWPLWPGCALLVAVLLLFPRRLWPVLIPAGFAGFVVYDLKEGVSVRSTALLILADTIEVLTAAVGIRYFFGGAPRLSSLKALAKYSVFGLILAPLSVTLVGAVAVSGDYWIHWRISFFSEALAFLTLAPAIWSWFDREKTWLRKSRTYYLEAAALLATLILLGYFTFIAPASSSQPVLLYSLLPLLLWSALRFGSLGITNSMVVVAFLSIWGAIHGRGPFTGAEPLKNVLSLQLFLFFAATPFIVLAALVEEHQQAERGLKKSEEMFSKAFHASPAIMSINSVRDLRYVRVNQAFERHTGYRQDEVEGRSVSETGHWDESGDLARAFQKLIGQGKLRNLEGRFRTKTGELLIGRVSAEIVDFAGEPCILTVTEDVTDLKRAEENCRLAVESAPSGMVIVDRGGSIILVNAQAEKQFGYRHEELVGKCIEALVTEPLPWRRLGSPEDFIVGLQAGPLIAAREFNGRRKDGTQFPVEISLNPMETHDGARTLVSIVDITDRKLSEEVLLDMSGRLITAHEEERTRIARELHDDLSQRMALVQIGIQQLSLDSPELSRSAKGRLKDIAQTATEISSDIHHMSHQLHPSKLDTLGLVAAVGGYCREFSEQHAFRIDFVRRDVPQQIPKDVTLCAYRILQESLRNVVKHSGAQEAKVELTGYPGGIELCVSDSGVGFDPESAKGKTGLGLIGMSERLRLVRGQLRLESQVARGTRVQVQIPLSSVNGNGLAARESVGRAPNQSVARSGGVK
jgi:PAS domain S-box-containing protein